MQRILFGLIFSIGLVFFSASFQNVLSQDRNESGTVQTDDGESSFNSVEALRQDYKMVHIVAYVKIKERKLVDFMGGEKIDCENDKGPGYCLYLLKAEIKEVFKGKIRTREIEFFTSPDADYPKKNLMGERVVFLNRSKNEKTGRTQYGTMENSTRRIKFGVIENLRKIAGKKSNRKN